MKIAIVGGGISGLFCAWSLQDNHDVTLYEASNRLGGKVHTIKKHGHVYEAGAGRFDPNAHTSLVHLMRKLAIDDSRWLHHANGEPQYVKDGEPYPIDTAALLQNIKPDPKKTLQTLLKLQYAPSLADDMAYSLGYQSMVDTMNSKDTLESFLTSKGTYCGLKGGMGSIIKALASKLECQIHIKTPITDFDPKTNAVTLHTGTKHRYDIVILATPSNVVQRFPSLVNQDAKLERTLSSLRGMPLMRIYACFPTPGGKPWFHNKKRTTTNGAIKQFIPLGGGLAMVSYCDGTHAEGMNRTSNAECISHLRKVFPNDDIPKPLWMDRFFWEVGDHCWLTNKRMYDNKNARYYVCGEAFSTNHKGWVEGALRSAESVVHKINKATKN